MMHKHCPCLSLDQAAYYSRESSLKRVFLFVSLRFPYTVQTLCLGTAELTTVSKITPPCPICETKMRMTMREEPCSGRGDRGRPSTSAGQTTKAPQSTATGRRNSTTTGAGRNAGAAAAAEAAVAGPGLKGRSLSTRLPQQIKDSVKRVWKAYKIAQAEANMATLVTEFKEDQAEKKLTQIKSKISAPVARPPRSQSRPELEGDQVPLLGQGYRVFVDHDEAHIHPAFRKNFTLTGPIEIQKSLPRLPQAPRNTSRRHRQPRISDASFGCIGVMEKDPCLICRKRVCLRRQEVCNDCVQPCPVFEAVTLKKHHRQQPARVGTCLVDRQHVPYPSHLKRAEESWRDQLDAWQRTQLEEAWSSCEESFRQRN